MKGKQMTDWKPVQFFLSPDSFGVFEVEVTSDNSAVRCTCNTYKLRTSCKHTRFVKRRMDANQGVYGTPLADYVDRDSEELIKSVADFARNKDRDARKFLLKFGKVEVL